MLTALSSGRYAGFPFVPFSHQGNQIDLNASNLRETPTSATEISLVDSDRGALLRGEILLKTQPHTTWGAAVTAQMYLPLTRSQVWQQVTNYRRWVQYFPALTASTVLAEPTPGCKRLYQVASKDFLLFTAQVDIYLKVQETEQTQIQFQLESGTFHDFQADLRLHDCQGGTLLTYFVQATPLIPIPSLFIQQAIQLDLPGNLRSMRQVLCWDR